MILLALVSLVNPLRQQLQSVEWKGRFPAVSTSAGFSTAASPGQIFRPLVHPGTLILLVALTSVALEIKSPKASERARRAAQATVRSAGITSLGVIIMVGLSTLMDHCGMSLLLAQGLSAGLGGAYPLLSPAVGMLGAFATGSNNNSNVLFGSMQKNVAVLLHLRPEVLIASQTAGGSLGSMLAPAKIIVGCSTVAQVGREGQVLRQTVPFGLGAGLVVGVLTFILSRLR
jgi:lactate permease